MMNKKPEISVIMAVYNCQDTVAEAIDSILNQTCQDFEFIICDDCSSDKTYEIVCEYAKRYPEQIKVLRNERNSKLAYALNHCLQHVQGKYVARMDGDDISVPDRLQKQSDFLEKNTEFSLVGSAISFFDNNGDWGKDIKKAIPNKYDLLKSGTFNHATIMMKKEAYEAIGYYTDLPRTLRCEDVDLWFKFFAKAFVGYNTSEILYRVRLDESGMKRRTFALRLNSIKTRIAGYQLLNFPWYCYFFILKPFIAGLIPNSLMLIYHKLKLR
ncbi:YveO [Lentisphaera araneosa HTCC2155]|uniref:YveO n=1 Tax=Lentisphaera araneosa HTCC2155 TaxID=313628 RepID=A6DHG1_9BACT|nr:glycosyltransferase [Lentisphaera araneosa]EDM29044.1 YveO [Lentisphaera araneosa HTCC2155]